MTCSQCFQEFPEGHTGPCPRCGHQMDKSAPGTPDTAEVDHKLVTQSLTNANLCRIRGQYSDAVENCVAALKLDAQNHTAHSLLGDIYRDQGRLEDSAQWYRMAIDIRSNPVDQSRLAAVEKEIMKLASGSGEPQQPIADAREWGGGTTNLMGVKPQRWLSLITAVSGIFLIITLVILLRHPSTKTTHALTNTPKPAGAAPSAPPPTLQLPVQPVPPAVNTTGGGLPADQPTVGTIEPRQYAPNIAPPRGELPATTPPAQYGVPTAPVLPAMPGVTGGQVTSAPTDNSAPAISSSPLTGNMQIGNMQNTGNGVVAIIVTAPTNWATAAGQSAGTTILRNILRAARTGIGSNPDYTEAHVFVEVPYGTNQLSIADGTVSRPAASAINPDNANYASLRGALTSFHWVNEHRTSSGVAAGSAPQVSSGS